MAIGVLILGDSGTGKSRSIKPFSPDEVKILSVYKPILPFEKSYEYELVKTPTGKDIIMEMKNTEKKNIVIDDFQYVLGRPMMHRISEKGWDKFNEIQQPYADVLEAISDLPDDVIVYLTSHTETDNNGRTKIKTIGNALDKYMTVEGLFMIVLGTVVVNDKYYFATQNSGNDTLKSPEGMFPSKWIPNDMKYVGDKIRNYYHMDDAKSDEEMANADAKHTVTDSDVQQTGGRRSRKSAAEVRAANKEKMDNYMEKVTEAVEQVAEGREAVPFEEVAPAIEDIPKPEQEPIPQRTRKNRVIDPQGAVCEKDTYFHISETDNYVKKHAGDPVPEGAREITEEEFGEGIKRIAQEPAPAVTSRRRRRV